MSFEFKDSNITFQKKDKAGVDLNVGELYTVLVNNCVPVHKMNKSNDDVEEAQPKDVKIRIFVGHYMGYASDRFDKNTTEETNLAFEMVNDPQDKTQLFIKVKDIESIEQVEERLPEDVRNAEIEAKEAVSVAEKAAKAALAEPDAAKKTTLKTTAEGIIQSAEAKLIYPVRDNTKAALQAKLEAATKSMASIQGGKKTARRGGASKRRLSKKEKKTRKAKRSGRKA
jgi:nitrogen regulatory protein PII-like uncharacterized protein